MNCNSNIGFKTLIEVRTDDSHQSKQHSNVANNPFQISADSQIVVNIFVWQILSYVALASAGRNLGILLD